MRTPYRRRPLVWCLALALTMTMPGLALAEDDPGETEVIETEAPVEEHEITEVLSTLPVLGTGLSVTVTRGEDGHIAAVALDPADGSTVIKENDHKVVFLLADGNTEVVVKVRGDTIQTKVRADAIADVTGPGSWSADVFGNGVVTIPYALSFEGNAPIITLGDIVAPEGVTVEVGEPKAGAWDDGDKAFYKIKVRLTSGEEKAKVTLVAKTYVDDETGEVKVRFAVSVSDRDRHRRWDDDDHRDRWDRDGEKKHDDDREEWDRDDDAGWGDHDRDHDEQGDDGKDDGDKGDGGDGDND